MARLRIDIWSDIACPWCYVGKRRLTAALARFAHGSDVAIVWRAFELDPEAPRVRDDGVSYAERLARKYGRSLAEAEAMIQRMTEVAAAEGLDFRFDRVRPGNTFDAHRLLYLAHERGVQEAVKERLFRAYLTEGEPIGRPDTLARLAREAGLDDDSVRAVLATDLCARQVRIDERDARELGIDRVPYFVIGGRIAVSGAQPVDLLLGAIQRAWAEPPEAFDPLDEGAACSPVGRT